MRLARTSAVALALGLTSALSACGDARDVSEREGGGAIHPIPFVAQHTAAARADIASCRICHGTDYEGGSAQSCTACHDTQIGFADWKTNCTFCHGGGVDGRDQGWAGPLAEAAPPQTAAGPVVDPDQTSSNAKVGAHQAHLVAGTFSNAVACASCHTVPAQTFPGSFTHVDGTADVEFSTTALRGGAGYAGAGGSCAVACHGSIAALGNNTSPAWTSAGGIACGDCHSATAPASGAHALHVTTCNVACASCHPGYAPPSTVNLATHVNGTFDAAPIVTTATFSTSTASAPAWPASCTDCHTTGVPPCTP